MKQLMAAILISSSLFLGGCQSQPADISNQEEQSLVVEKSGEISTKMGDEWLLKTSDGIVNLNSNKVNLDSYLKKRVTVKGMYSGSTLYVDEISQD